MITREKRGFNVVFSSVTFHAPALNVRTASPAKSVKAGVVAVPFLLLVPNLAHLCAPLAFWHVHPVTSY